MARRVGLTRLHDGSRRAPWIATASPVGRETRPARAEPAPSTVAPEKVVTSARHPRNNPAWPRVGIFAQRGKNRPNRIGSTICRIVSVEGRTLTVAQLDAIDGTPVLDLKPVMREFLPREPTTQPAWVAELMADYWAHDGRN